jgi:preprotein translocase subunit SecE
VIGASIKSVRDLMNKVKQYFTEVAAEMKKVSWSSKEDIIASTVAVMASCVVLGIFIWVVDVIISNAMALILR